MASSGESGVEWDQAIDIIRPVALAYPGAFEAHPWGEVCFKAANKKGFVFSSTFEGVFRFSCKLPHSSEAAVTMFSFCAPTGYGMGASGWVTASFPKGALVPVPMLLEWMEESYEAVAGAKAGRTAREARAIQAISRTVKEKRAAAASKNAPRKAESKTARPGKAAPKKKPAPGKNSRPAKKPEAAAATKKSGGKQRKAEATGKRGSPTGKFAFESGK